MSVRDGAVRYVARNIIQGFGPSEQWWVYRDGRQWLTAPMSVTEARIIEWALINAADGHMLGYIDENNQFHRYDGPTEGVAP